MSWSSGASASSSASAVSERCAKLNVEPVTDFRFAGFFDRGALSEYGLATTSLSRLEAARVPELRPPSEFCRDAAFPRLSALEKECCRIASRIIISRARRLARRNMSRSDDIVAGFTMTSFMPAATH